jgi:hypothetical protein
MMKIYAIEIIFKSHEPFQSYLLTGQADSAKKALKGVKGFENNFNGIYFHHNFYLKTGVSRNGLSPGYSERDIISV